MINPVTFGAGPSTAPARPNPEEVAKRFESVGRAARASASVGESRVRISAEGAQRAQAEAQAGQLAREQAAAPDAARVADAVIRSEPQRQTQATRPASTAHAQFTESALDLAFDVADGNRDGTVTISEQQRYETRTVRMNGQQPQEWPGPAGSGPIRAYLDVGGGLTEA